MDSLVVTILNLNFNCYLRLSCQLQFTMGLIYRATGELPAAYDHAMDKL